VAGVQEKEPVKSASRSSMPTKRYMRPYLAGLIAAGGMYALSPEIDRYLLVCPFHEVVDGDTVRCRHRDLRIASIDAPEKSRSCGLPERIKARIAKRKLESLLAWQVVFIPTGNTDKYGRWIIDPSRGSEKVASLLVDQGLAIRCADEECSKANNLHDWCGTGKGGTSFPG
jgi:hypothetical protein